MKLLRFLFYHLYHGFAWTYDFVAATVSIGRWQDWVLSSIPYLAGPRILEIGHGPGHLQAAMFAQGLRPVGLDESREMGRIASARLARRGFPSLLCSGYAQSMPFSSESFDTVVATFPSEYIFDARSLAEIRRVLHPGRSLVVIPSAWIGGREFFDRVAAWLFRVTRQGEPLPPAAQERIKAIFREAGFDVRIETVEKRSSTVLVLLATKPA